MFLRKTYLPAATLVSSCTLARSAVTSSGMLLGSFLSMIGGGGLPVPLLSFFIMYRVTLPFSILNNRAAYKPMSAARKSISPNIPVGFSVDANCKYGEYRTPGKRLFNHPLSWNGAWKWRHYPPSLFVRIPLLYLPWVSNSFSASPCWVYASAILLILQAIKNFSNAKEKLSGGTNKIAYLVRVRITFSKNGVASPASSDVSNL